MPGLKRSVAAIVGVPLLGVTLAGCGVAQTADTPSPFEATSPPSSAVANLAVRNVLVASDGQGSGSLVAYISNRATEDDALREVRIEGQPVALPEPVEIAALSYVSIGGPGGPRVEADNLEAAPGQYVTVQFVFRRAPQATFRALVVPVQGPYASLTPTAPPQPTGAATSPAPTASPGATPEPEASESPGTESPGTESPGSSPSPTPTTTG